VPSRLTSNDDYAPGETHVRPRRSIDDRRRLPRRRTHGRRGRVRRPTDATTLFTLSGEAAPPTSGRPERTPWPEEGSALRRQGVELRRRHDAGASHGDLGHGSERRVGGGNWRSHLSLRRSGVERGVRRAARWRGPRLRRLRRFRQRTGRHLGHRRGSNDKLSSLRRQLMVVRGDDAACARTVHWRVGAVELGTRSGLGRGRLWRERRLRVRAALRRHRVGRDDDPRFPWPASGLGRQVPRDERPRTGATNGLVAEGKASMVLRV
jgi:hypothetical protein